LPCGLLNGSSSLRGLTLLLLRCYLAFACELRQCNYWLVVNIR